MSKHPFYVHPTIDEVARWSSDEIVLPAELHSYAASYGSGSFIGRHEEKEEEEVSCFPRFWIYNPYSPNWSTLIDSEFFTLNEARKSTGGEGVVGAEN